VMVFAASDVFIKNCAPAFNHPLPQMVLKKGTSIRVGLTARASAKIPVLTLF